MLFVLAMLDVVHADPITQPIPNTRIYVGGQSFGIETLQSLPAGFNGAAPSGIVESDGSSVDGNGHFPFQSTFGYTILPPTLPTGLSEPSWSFELFDNNPALWRVVPDGSEFPGWSTYGYVTDGFSLLNSIITAPQEQLFGLTLPVDAEGNPYLVTNVIYYAVTSSDDPPMGAIAQPTQQIVTATVPEPSTLAILAGAVFVRVLQRRKRSF
jgi:hypothetical protein